MATFIENAPEQIGAAAKDLLEKGLVEGTSGNISARMGDSNIAVTPSSLDYRIMTVEDIVIVNPAGDVVSGERGPTSEVPPPRGHERLPGHRGANTTPTPCTTDLSAVAHQDIPSCIDEFTVYLGGDIRCTETARAARPSWPSRWSRPSRIGAPH